MLIYVKKKNFLRTDRQTDGQPKTLVRNLTIHRENHNKKKSRHFTCLCRGREGASARCPDARRTSWPRFVCSGSGSVRGMCTFRLCLCPCHGGGCAWRRRRWSLTRPWLNSPSWRRTRCVRLSAWNRWRLFWGNHSSLSSHTVVVDHFWIRPL